MTPTFSLITPSIQRESLLRCCQSVDTQTLHDGWQHIVIVDCENWNLSLISKIQHPQRVLIKCGQRHGNYGNKCRHHAWEYATGENLVMLDDDNYLADDKILEDMAVVLADVPYFALFPIFRHGHRFFYDPPGLCFTDTLNVVVKREIGRWPDIEAREADGHWVEALKAEYPYNAFPDFRCIGVMPYSSNGV